MDDFFQSAIIISLLAGTIRIATPLLFAALGELVTERSGVLNLCVEGMLQMGALVGFLVGYQSGNLWLGVLAAGGWRASLWIFFQWVVFAVLIFFNLSCFVALLPFSRGRFYWYPRRDFCA